MTNPAYVQLCTEWDGEGEPPKLPVPGDRRPPPEKKQPHYL